MVTACLVDRPRLYPLLEGRRVIVCVGCGGVGKTTVAASLALAAARRGRRVLCLTIDPARRLANALGLARMESEAQRIAPEVFASAGLQVTGELTVMMLDPKRTFDDLVARHAPDPAVRDRILGNQVYGHLSSRLAGTQEYMAVEKLLAVVEDPAYDLVVLDTPPTSNALDFLDAPERLIAVLDSPMARWIAQAFGSRRRFRLDLVAQSAALALRGLARLTGSGFLEQMGEFLREFNALFGGFRGRAEAVSRALRRDDFAYVLVTSPEPESLREVLFFADRLAQHGLRRDAIVINRVHLAPGALPEAADVEAAMRRHDFSVELDGSSGLAARVVRATLEEAALARRDFDSFRVLDGLVLGPDEPPPQRVLVPALAADVHDVAGLAWVADRLY